MSEVRGAATGVGRVLPYAMVFGVAAFLLYRAQHFEFSAPVDQVGPDSWPKLILYMIMATSAFEGARRLLSARGARSGSAVVPTIESPFEREPADMRVVAGAMMTIRASIVRRKMNIISSFERARARDNMGMTTQARSGYMSIASEPRF